MKPSDIQEWTSYISSSLSTLLNAALQPINLPFSLIREQNYESEQLVSTAIKIWVSGFFLSLVFQLPIYRLIGIDWSDPAFFAPYTVVIFGLFAGTAYCIHISLKREGVQSDFSSTFLTYSVVFGAVAPFFTVLTFSTTGDVLQLLRAEKLADQSYSAALVSVFSSPELMKEIASPISQILSSFALIFSCMYFGVLQHSLAAVYGCSRKLVSRAIGFAIGVLLFPVFVVAVYFMYFVMFVFL
jgi:hypothetical protein